MQQIVVCGVIVVVGAVLGANLYNSWVDAPNWGRTMPKSLEVARAYFAVASPANFFRLFAPLSEVLALAALILCWRTGGTVRMLAASGLAFVIIGDILTFAYFYPRNVILFLQPLDTSAAMTAWKQWSVMNHVRSAVVLLAMASELALLARLAGQ